MEKAGIFGYQSAQRFDSARCIFPTHFAVGITTIPSWLLSRRGKKMRAVAFCGESPSQLSGAFVHFGDRFQGDFLAILEESILSLPSPRNSENLQKMLKICFNAWRRFLDRLVASLIELLAPVIFGTYMGAPDSYDASGFRK